MRSADIASSPAPDAPSPPPTPQKTQRGVLDLADPRLAPPPKYIPLSSLEGACLRARRELRAAGQSPGSRRAVSMPPHLSKQFDEALTSTSTDLPMSTAMADPFVSRTTYNDAFDLVREVDSAIPKLEVERAVLAACFSQAVIEDTELLLTCEPMARSAPSTRPRRDSVMDVFDDATVSFSSPGKKLHTPTKLNTTSTGVAIGTPVSKHSSASQLSPTDGSTDRSFAHSRALSLDTIDTSVHEDAAASLAKTEDIVEASKSSTSTDLVVASKSNDPPTNDCSGRPRPRENKEGYHRSLQRYKAWFVNAQSVFPAKAIMFVGNLDAAYNDLQLTIMVRMLLLPYDEHVAVDVKRVITRACVKPHAIVQFSAESHLEAVLKRSYRRRHPFHIGRRVLRIARSTACRHVTVVYAHDPRRPPTLDEVSAFLSFCGVIESITLDLRRCAATATFLTYGGYLSAVSGLRSGVTPFVMV